MEKSYMIEPVTDSEDIHILAAICDEALKPDSFHRLLTLTQPESVYEAAVKAMSDSLEDPNGYLFKAILDEPDENGVNQRKIVGLSQWFIGYISIPKVDPFETEANPVTSEVVENSVAPMAIPEHMRAAFEEGRTRGWNAYIGAIRGRKHLYLRRIAVLPAYQRRGIASKLMQWGAELADREGIVGWVNARPAGIRLYKNFGWEPVASASFNVPGVDIEPVVSMFRKRAADRKT